MNSDELKSIALEIQRIKEYALFLAKGKVYEIISNEVTNVREIEKTLDFIMDINTFESDKLFNRLIVYYKTVDIERANDYIRIKQDLYGEEEEVLKR